MLLKTRIKSSTELSSYKMLTVCPLLVVTTTVTRALAMAFAFVLTLFLSQVIVALSKKAIPLKLRSVYFFTVTAFCASVTELLMWIAVPSAADSLGVYLPVLAVSCIILLRLESTKAENTASKAIIDSLVTGSQMFLVMICASLPRELFGIGRIFSDFYGEGGILVFKTAPLPIFNSTTGMLLLVGIGAAVAKTIVKKKKTAARMAALNDIE